MKNGFFGVLLIAVGLVVAPIPLVAHHGSASFDTTKDVTLKGTVTEWIWANPHCFLKFDAMDDAGTVRNWAVETQNPTGMTQRGWSRRSFKAGDQVTVILQAVKNGAAVGRILRVIRGDGSTLEAGAVPVAAPTQPAQ